MAKIINKRKVMAIARKAIYNFTSDAKPIDAFLDRDRDLNILLADPSKHLFINWDELDEILDKTTTDKTKCYLVSSTRTPPSRSGRNSDTVISPSGSAFRFHRGSGLSQPSRQ